MLCPIFAFAPLLVVVGQVDSSSSSFDLGDLEELVVTGDGVKHRSIEAPTRTEVIGKKQIDASGARTLGEALRVHPGARINTDVTGIQTIQLGGFSGEHVLVLIDGMRPAGTKNGSFDLSRISAQDIERIEILKGAASARYGAGALGGVINIITKKPGDQLKVRGMASQGYGPASEAALSNLQVSGELGSKQWSGRVGANYLRRSSVDLDPELAGTSLDQLDDLKLSGSAHTDLGEGGKLSFRGDYNYRVLNGIDGGPILPRGQQAIFDRQADVHTLGFAAQMEYPWDADLIRASLGYQFYGESQNRIQRIELAEKLETIDIHQLLAQLSYSHLFGENHLFEVGGEFFFDDIEATRYPVVPQRARGALLLQDEWDLVEGLLIVPGLRWDFDSQFGQQPSPRLAFRYNPSRNTALRVSWAQGFKAPLARDLGISFSNPSQGYRVEGNPDLIPEISTNFKGSVDTEINKSLNLSYSVSYSLVRDLIAPVVSEQSSPGGAILYTYGNIDEARILALEVQVQHSIHKYLTVSGSYTFLDTENVKTKEQLPDRAPHALSGRIHFDYQPWELSLWLQGQWVDKRQIVDLDGETISQAPDYFLSDFHVRKDWSDSLTMDFAINNITDAGDPTFLTILPRMFRLGLEWRQ